MLKRCGRSFISLLLVFLLITSLFTVSGSAASWIWGKSTTTKTLTFQLEDGTSKTVTFSEASSKFANAGLTKYATVNVNDNTEKTVDVTVSSRSQADMELTFKVEIPNGYIMRFDYQVESTDGIHTQTCGFVPPGSTEMIYADLEDGNSYMVAGSLSSSGSSNNKSVFRFYLDSSQKTHKAHLTNITLEKAVYRSVTVKAPTGGSVTANDSEVSATTGDVVFPEVGSSSGLKLTPAPDSGYTFAGYKINDSELLIAPTVADYTYFPDVDDSTVEAVFIPATEPSILVGNTTGYKMVSTLREAVNEANENGYQYIIPITDITVPDDGNGSYDIPSGVTLVIPNDAERNVYRTEPNILYNSSGYYTKNPSRATTLAKIGPTVPYVTMTVSENVIINVASGAEVSVGGIQWSPNGGGSACVKGGYGLIIMKEGAKLNINNGAFLYAWGFVVSDPPATSDSEPSVICESGATVYEMFQITDYSGGSIISDIVPSTGGCIFPFSQYYVQNVEAKMKLNAGSREYVVGALTAAGSAISTGLMFIGDAGMFTLNAGCAIKYYDYEQDKLICRLDENADAAINPMALNVGIELNTANFQLPISNIGVEIAGNSTVEINQDLQLFPDSYVTLDENSSLDINCNVYVADKATIDGHVMGNVSVKPMVFSATRYIETGDGASHRTANSLDEPYIINDGEVTINPTAKGNDTVGSLNLVGEGGTITGTGTITNNAADSVSPGDIKLISFYYDTDKKRQAGKQEPDPGENDTQCDDIEAMGMAYSYDETRDIWHTDTVSIYFVDSDDEEHYEFIEANYGDTVTAPTWTQEGYKLTWVNGSDVEDTYKPGDSFEAIRFAYYWTEWTEKTAETYTVTWKNDDGTVLETDTDVAEGATPSYGGETPAKESTAQYSYTFAGWSTDGETVIDPLPEVTGDVTYIAVYTETTRTYTVTWTDEFGSELETDYNVPYGTMPIFNSMAPTKDQTEQYTYSFAGWSTDGENVINPLPEVTKDVTYTAQFTQTLRKYMITFLADEFEDHVLQSTEVEYGAVPVYTGEEPTKEAVAAYFFDFAGWSTDGETVIDPLPAVTGEATYRPAFTATLNTYTITWNNWDGSLLEKDENVPFDTMPEYNGDTPTRPADDTYTYTFDGWDPAVESVGGDKIYTAKFTSKLKPTEGYYVVGNFTSDPDGRQWRPGTDFKLDTIEENELYVIRNVALTTSSEFKILYSYDGTDRTTWYPGGDNYGAGGQITADGSYDIYFRKNGDGNTNLGWYEGYIMVLNAGDELPTEPEPTEPPAAGYYVVGNFTTWGLDEAYLMTQVDGADPDLYVFRDLELTTTSQFKVVYTPNGTSQTWYPSGMWNNYGESGEITADGTYDVYFRPDGEGSTDDGWHYGYILAIPAGTELPTEPPTEPPAPTDPPIAPGYYIVGTFTDNEIDETYMMTLNEDQTDYTEYVFTDLALTTDARFKVVGVDENGNQTTYPGAYADPYGAWGQIKSDDTYTVYFRPDGNGDGAWYNGYIKVPGNFVPVTPGYYVIGTFTDWQLDQDYMMTLNEDADVTEYVLRNIHLTKTDDTTDMFKVVYTSNGYETNTWYPSGMGNNYGQNGEIPVDAAYDIYFRPNGQDGWFHDYIFAQDLTPYTVIWRNWNNEVLETDENMLRGMTPEYNGATPTRDATAQYTYTFDGWYPVPTTVQGDMVFRAEFTPTVNKYTIQFVDEDGTELQSSEVEYGAVPVYTSETPTKEATAQYTYAFDGWKDNTTTYGKDDPLPEVTGDQTYTAVYKDVTNTYTVIWQNEDGTELEKDEYVPYGTTPSYDGATPTKAATAQYTYTFKDWDPAVSDVTGDVTYKATYTETVNKYIITWKDGNGDTLKTEQVAYGETPAYDGETPTKTATAQYTYTFNNTWSPEIAEVTENATYTAQFDSTVNKYTITWIDGNGDTLKTEQVAYGETPAYTGATPTKTATAQYSYTFNNTWSPAIISVTGDATYTAQFDQTVNEYTITWIDGNGDTLKTEQVAYGEIPAYTGETPTKTATAEFTYTFNNTWTPEIVSVTGDATYTAQFAESARKYTITWKNSDTTLKTEEIAYGEIPEYTGETPTMEGDDQYTYFFTGWTPAVVPVTGDATYTAVFGNTTNTYTITWLDEDGTELKKENVAYGSIPSYGENPTKEADVQYTYTFAGWTPFVAPVTGDATYKATYTSTVNEYTITWKNGEDIIKTEQVAYGETPAYTGETPAKDSTASTDYTFSGWDPEAAPVTGDATYTAQFTESVRKYTVTWKNGDTTLKTEEVAYGEIPVYDGETPTKAADAQYTYTFNNTWTPEIVAVTEDATYTAQFDSTVNKYTITWIDGNGDTLKTEQVAYGETPAYTGETPTKTATAHYTYTFNNTWTPEITSVTGNAEYTAQFDQTVNEYTITWIDGNGDTLKTEQVAYGETPAYTGETPTKAATAEFTYTFNNTWTPEIVSVTGDATYTAQFDSTENAYTVTWLDDDDTIIDTTLYSYLAVPTHADPTKEATAEYTYTFTGWTPVITPVTADVTYKATYTATKNEYTITWIDGNGDTLKTEQVAYGETPAYTGETPTKAADAQYTYTFNNTWTPEIVAVTEDVTYTAQFDSTVNKYTITWIDGNGDTLKTEQVAYGETPAYTGETPTKTATAHYTYTFNNTWTPEITSVTGNAEYTAQFDQAVNEYTITWIDGNGDTLKTEQIAYGETPAYTGETPTKTATAQYTYTFNNTWTPEIVAVTEDATYTAQFDSTVNEYTITWIDGNGDTLKTEQVAYGEIPAYTGETPTKTATAELTYIFNNTWTPEIIAVTEDATYTAQFDSVTNTYTVIWLNEDGEELEKDENVPYGTEPSYDGETPTKEADALYTYTFSGWDPEVDTVTGDITYKAVFTSTAKVYSVSHSLSLEGQIHVNFYWQIPDDSSAGYTYTFSFMGTTIDPLPLPTEADAVYGYKTAIAVDSPEMTEEITAKLYKDGVLVMTDTFKAADYAAAYDGQYQAVDTELTDNTPYLIGKLNGSTNWSKADPRFKFTDNPINADEYMLANVALTAGDEFKVVKYYEATESYGWYPDGDTPNYQITQNGVYNIYFKKEANAVVDDWYYDAFYVETVSTDNDVYQATLLPTLLQATMSYGANAQKYFKVNSTDLADTHIDEKGSFIEVTQDMINARLGDNETRARFADDIFAEYGLTYYGSSLVMNANTKIKLYFTVSNAATFAGYKDSFRFNGEAVEAQKANNAGSIVYFELDGIAPANLHVRYVLDNTAGNASLDYAALDYATTCMGMQESNANLYNLTQALYWYNIFADAYFKAA